MNKSKWPGALAAIALLAGSAPVLLLAPASPALAQQGNGTDATYCVSLNDGKLVNNCGFVIEVSWCVENVDCRNGYYSNTWTIGANSYYPINGGLSGNYVRWGACKGRNSITTRGTSAYSWDHICNQGY